MKKEQKELDMPTVEQLQAELRAHNYQKKFNQVLKNSFFSLVVVAAFAVLAAMLWFPVLQISGDSMTETLQDKDIVVSLRHSKCQTGDIIAFYFNNTILVKRVIATSGQWVDIDEDGNVYIDGVLLEEDYLSEKALGECNVEFPFQVPEGRYFVMGDCRAVSIDSRNTAVGCVSSDMVVGKIFFRIWPFKKINL